jgi:hypothetical protein
MVSSNKFDRTNQGCQMVDFKNENPNLGKFSRALNWTMLIYVMAIWNIYEHKGYFMTIWYIFCRFWYHVARKIWHPWIAFPSLTGMSEF